MGLHVLESWKHSCRRSKSVRAELTKRKLNQRKRLIEAYGLQQGTLYEKHREKISKSLGYMRDGNVRHFVAVRPRRKTSINGLSPHDERRFK